MDMSKENYYRTEVLNVGSTSFLAYRPAMKALAVLSDGIGADEVVRLVSSGDTDELVRYLKGCNGYDGSPGGLVADEIARQGAFSIFASREGEEYRICRGSEADGACGEICYRPTSPMARPFPFETARMIRDDIMRDHPEETPFDALLLETIARCRRGKCKAMHGVTSFAPPTDTIPLEFDDEPEDGEPRPEERPTTVIRETVVVREQPPVLENMLREAFANVVAQVNIDELGEEIKKKLRDEFGFEPVRHTVRIADIDRDVEGIVHEKFDSVLHFIANDVPAYLYGPSGTGKGVLCEQAAKALGLEYHYMNSVTDEFKINGFIDAYGNYHETPFYRAFTGGGLFFLDELDASAPEVLVCLNMAIANRRYSFPNGSVEAHPDFRVVAAGNTLGTGADASYTGRMQLDAASLNRFVVIEVGYDKNIDSICAQGDDELVTFIRRFREVVKGIGLPVIASYRNISQIKVAEAALPLEACLSSCLCKEMNQDDINIVSERLSDISGNRYYSAFKRVSSIVG